MAYKWITVANGFPPTINKTADATTLKPDETPDGYGYSLVLPGRLAVGTVPTGTARNVKTYTISTATYNYFYDRLWLASGATLTYGAPHYTGTFLKQGVGEITFPEATSITTYLPVGNGGLGVLTDVGAFYVANADREGGEFTRGPLVQEIPLATATYATSLNGVIYLTNADGLFAWDGAEVREISYPVRHSVGSFASVALTCDYDKDWIIGTSKFVYDAGAKRLYDFGASGFRYTTPTIVSDKFRPFGVSALRFAVEHTTDAGGSLKYQTRFEDDDWDLEQEVDFSYVEGAHTSVMVDLPIPRTVHKFALRLVDLSSNVYIKEIQLHAEDYVFGDMAE